MKFLLKLLFVLLSLVGVLLIIALFVDGKYSVSRTVQVNTSQESAYEFISHLSNQQEYGVWHRKDPNISIKTTGTDATVGYISKWDSKVEDVGAGEQEITRLVDGRLMETEIRFKRPMEITSRAILEAKKISNNSTSITWTFEGENPYPFNLMGLFMDMDKELGPDLNNGLKNLKRLLESDNN